jgi:hypothetical protein
MTLVPEGGSHFDQYATEGFIYSEDQGGYFGTCLYTDNHSQPSYFFAMILIIVDSAGCLASALIPYAAWLNYAGEQVSRAPYYQNVFTTYNPTTNALDNVDGTERSGRACIGDSISFLHFDTVDVQDLTKIIGGLEFNDTDITSN